MGSGQLQTGSRRLSLVFVVMLFTLVSCVACRDESLDPAESFPNDPEARGLAGAVARDDAGETRGLIREGADPDSRGREGITLLQYAVLCGSYSALDALLDAGADPNAAGNRGDTTVHTAANADTPEAMELILQHGGDPNARNSMTGSTALVPTILMHNDAQFQMLLDAGTDPNIADRNDDAPIHTAGRTNAGDYILKLLEAGADPRARNSGGATFQEYYFSFPQDVLSDRAKDRREAVRDWLREHDVPLWTPPASGTTTAS